MKTTGEAIHLDKSFAYAISFRFNNKGEYRFESVEEVEAQLSVKNKYGIRENLYMIKLDKGIDTLGILLAPNGSMKD